MEKVVRRKIAYRKKTQNRFSMILVGMVVALLTMAVFLKSIEMKHRLQAYEQTEYELTQQIEAEKQRSEEIDEFRKYTQTKRYVEEVAKDKLGLVYEGEIVFQEDK